MESRPPDLRWLALVTLAELVAQVRAGPIRPTYAARLALAVCYRHSDGDRQPFDDFWRQMQKSMAGRVSDTTAEYCRSSYLRAAFRGVLRAVGIEPTVDVEIALSDAASKSQAPRDEA
jgi:hypothetical protein